MSYDRWQRENYDSGQICVRRQLCEAVGWCPRPLPCGLGRISLWSKLARHSEAPGSQPVRPERRQRRCPGSRRRRRQGSWSSSEFSHLFVGRDVRGVADPTIMLRMHVDSGRSTAAATTALFADRSGGLVDLITDVLQLIERFYRYVTATGQRQRSSPR